MIQNLKSITIYTPDIEKSVAWYEKFLNRKQNKNALVTSQCAVIPLGSTELRFQRPSSDALVSESSSCIFSFEVNNIDFTVSRAIENGGTLVQRISQTNSSPIRQAYLKDPYGTIFSIECHSIAEDNLDSMEFPL